jgi:hypothetical protein
LEKSVARYLAQLDSADLQEPSQELAMKTAHLREKLIKLESEMQRLATMEKLMLASPDQQISLTDPDSRSMATSGRGSGVVGYNVQVAVDTKHHLIVTHEVTNDGSDRAQLANIACQAKEVLGVGELEAVADRGYYSGEKILACHEAGITVTLPKPVTSGIEARGRFGKQDFVYLGDKDTYRCPAGEKLKYHYTNEENGQSLRRYWTNACRDCGLKRRCTTGVQRRIARWEARKPFRLPLLGDEISLDIRIRTSFQNMYAHNSTNSDVDLDHPFSRVAGYGRLGGNDRANGRGTALGLCDDCGRTASKPIGGWRCADLDGRNASPLLEPLTC